MPTPTEGELFAILTEHMRLAQETAAMLAHINRDNNKLKAMMWLLVSEKYRENIHVVTKIAKGSFRA